MKKRIFWKFFAAFFVFSLCLALLSYFLMLGQIRSLYLETAKEQLQKVGDLFHAELSRLWPELDAGALKRYVKEKGSQAQVRLTVINPQGNVLADSEKDPRLMQNHSDRPEFAAALSGHTRSEIHFSFTLRKNMLYFAQPLRVTGKTVAALRVSIFFKEIEAVVSPWRWKLSAALLGLLCLSLFISFLLSRNLSRPIRELAQAARLMASGTLDIHVRSRRRDEIGQLAADFNAMVDSQKDMVGKLRYSQHELETILASISDGLLVIDSQERITRAGPRFCHLINDPNPVGKPFWEVLRQSSFDELVKKAGAGQTVHTEMEISGRLFLASLSPLPAACGVVIVFHDLTETRQLEKIKRDFIANVSHELRTPLTAIKGYSETLAEDATGESRRYLEVIARHTDRMIDLTTDLLALSSLEEKGLQPQLEAINFQDMLTRIRSLFEKKILEKNLTLDITLIDHAGYPAFRGDPFRLEQMFINLLDNAVKYTEKGGITIRMAASSQSLVIEVKDSGIGIAAEHLPRLFERFYVSDKARSRQTGGTGLGLAIVKHIVGLHHGEISVQSKPGAGTVFTIVFPLRHG